MIALEQALARFSFYRAQIEALEQHIRAVLASLATNTTTSLETKERPSGEVSLQTALRVMMGVDLTRIPTIGVETALIIASEIGPDLARFPTSAQFCSWLTLAPGTRISGDRKLSGAPPTRVNRVGQALRMAAASARSSKSYVGAAHRARLSRLDTARANKATAHQLARLIYAMLTRGGEFVNQDIEIFERQRREQEVKVLQRRARRIGMALIEDAA